MVEHLAVIMDGNRRWAKARGLASVEGHKAGLMALKNLVRLCPRYGIKHLTAYAFSTENWKRSQIERDFIFSLLEEAAIKDLEDLVDNGVRVDFWGNFDKFQGTKLLATIESLTERTRNNNIVHLHIALSYGSYQELYDAYTKIQLNLNSDQISNLTTSELSELLYSRGVPDPELLIRTGGEMRLSNYLLYQCSNSSMCFLDDFWPDFGEKQLQESLQAVATHHSKCSEAIQSPRHCETRSVKAIHTS